MHQSIFITSTSVNTCVYGHPGPNSVVIYSSGKEEDTVIKLGGPDLSSEQWPRCTVAELRAWLAARVVNNEEQNMRSRT